MKILAINGSPRKIGNTALLLYRALEGAASQGAESELIHLYDLNFKGCISCFACKRKGGKSYGKCAMNDDLTPILEKVESADAIILGSPIYAGTVTGVIKSFMERLIFQYSTYGENSTSLFKRKIRTGFIYTMAATESMAEDFGYPHHFKLNEQTLARTLGTAESLIAIDTQFLDYIKDITSGIAPAKKAANCEEVFPQDCEKAFTMGVKFAS